MQRLLTYIPIFLFISIFELSVYSFCLGETSPDPKLLVSKGVVTYNPLLKSNMLRN